MKHLKKNIRSVVRIIYVSIILGVLCLSLYQCNSPRPETDRKIKLTADDENERDAIRNDLRALDLSIDRELVKIKAKLENASDENEEQLLLADRKLQSSKAKVDKALEDIDQASGKNWREVRAVARNTMTDVKEAFDKLAYDMDDLFKSNN
jgi:hypothetical protein